jgi:adenylylsulfate kinase
VDSVRAAFSRSIVIFCHSYFLAIQIDKEAAITDNDKNYSARHSSNTVLHPRLLHAGRRSEILHQKPLTVWLTGLSGSGKSTIAVALEARLLAMGRLAYVLDGDSLRQGVNGDLGFSETARQENIRRTAEIAAMFNDAGLIVIVALISPYRKCRETARSIIGADRFLETYISASLAACEDRDTKGLYRRARNGEIENFTGISSPYEEPTAPGLTLDTTRVDTAAAIDLLLQSLCEHGVIATTAGSAEIAVGPVRPSTVSHEYGMAERNPVRGMDLDVGTMEKQWHVD